MDTNDLIAARTRAEYGVDELRAENERLRAAPTLSRVWLLRAMCHCEKCRCADRGGMIGDYDMCRIVSRHANAIVDRMRAGEAPAQKEG